LIAIGKKAELSLFIRSSMVTQFNVGINVKNIANEFIVSRQTLYYQIKKFMKHNDSKNLKRTGPKRKITIADDKILIREFKKNSSREAPSLCNAVEFDR